MPFVRLTNEANHEHHGYDLGLAIAKKIIEQHGWKIKVEDSRLNGSKFIIYSPRLKSRLLG